MRNIVYDLIKDISGCNEINDNMSLENDLGLDSLNRIMLIINIEEKTGITFEATDMNPEELLTVGNIVNLLKKYEV